ncbi:MAG: hypothetical protein JST39_04650, partial [Bacteroidetes bacterium]|nr:hypothetical protein [Bacteroidota bacterium]
MLTRYNRFRLKEVGRSIRSFVPAGKIYLLAVRATSDVWENVFVTTRTARREVSHYCLLVLTENPQHRSNEALQDAIGHRCRHLTPVTAWVLSVAVFIQWLEAGQPFAVQAYRHGLLCHDSGRVSLPEPPVLNAAQTAAMLRRECSMYLKRSAEFLKGAELYYLRRQFRLSAFSLHQAAEQAYIAISWQYTGFRPMVHNLEKLHRYALPFSAALCK